MFNLGLSLEYQGRLTEAYAAYYKATWNDGWQAQAFYHLSRISLRNNEPDTAMNLINQALIKNYHNHKARHLKVIILRILGRNKEALELITESLGIDQFNMAVRYEEFLIYNELGMVREAAATKALFKNMLRNDPHNFIEYAVDYGWAGQYGSAAELLSIVTDECEIHYPMLYYYLGYYMNQCSNFEKAEKYIKKASASDPSLCFPNKLEDIIVLQNAIRVHPGDAKAHYFLGNLWYDKRQYTKAMDCWEQSIARDNTFPTVQRNLALACYNKKRDPVNAAKLLNSAFELDTTDARVLMELDQLNKRIQVPPETRLALLNKYPDLVEYRDDLYLERAALLNHLENYDQAKALLASRKFHPWEGGEGKVVEQYKNCRIQLARIAIKKCRYDDAVQLLMQCMEYPDNLGEGKLTGTQENDIHYYLGLTHELSGNEKEAKKFYELASKGLNEPGAAIFYNDQKPDGIFYQGLALLKLGYETSAKKKFQLLVHYGKEHANDEVKLDYFAVSLPDLLIFDEDLNRRNRIHCSYLIGLGSLGLGDINTSNHAFKEVLNLDCYHWGAFLHIKMINNSLLRTIKIITL